MVYEKSLIKEKGPSAFIATHVSSPEQFTSFFSREVCNEKIWSSGRTGHRGRMRARQQRYGSRGRSSGICEGGCRGDRAGCARRRLRAHESGERQCRRDLRARRGWIADVDRKRGDRWARRGEEPRLTGCARPE